MNERVVVVLGGNMVIGRVLELLLRMIGYQSRFLQNVEPEELGDLMPDTRLIILLPLLGAERREAYLQSLADSPAAVVPLLELVRDGDEAGSSVGDVMFWPSSLDDLERKVRSAIGQYEAC